MIEEPTNEDIFKANMREFAPELYVAPQHTAGRKNPALRAALKNASKNNKSKTEEEKGEQGKRRPGKPDATIFQSMDCKKVLALVEVKGSKNIQKAKGQAKKYVTDCAKEKLHIPLAIGFDGENLTVDYYSASGEFYPCRLENGQTFEERYAKRRIWPTAQEFISASRSHDGQVQENHDVLENEVTRDFILKINNAFYNKGVPTLDRVVIFTAFLVACRTESFCSEIHRKNSTPAAVGEACLSGIRTLIRTMPDKGLRDGLNGFVDLVKSKLVGRDDDEVPNGANSIHAIINDVLPEIESTHGIDSFELIARINKSMFNLVDVYEAFQAYSPENDLGQYFTPRHTVRAMIRLVEKFRGRPLDENDIVYDPACGVGGFLVGALEAVAKSKHGEERERVKRAFGERLIGCDHANEIIQVARVNLWMHGDGASLLSKGSSLERHYLPAGGKGTSPGDNGIGSPIPEGHPVVGALKKLKDDRKLPDGSPTVVLMNPPFPTKAKDYHAFEFIEHALKTMREGGYLCAVVPATTIVVEDKAHLAFRKRLAGKAQILAVIGNAPDLFQPGASVNTYILLIRKNEGGHQSNQPVLFARCPDDGYAMNRTTQRRVGPSEAGEYQKRRWCETLHFGGDLADLLVYNTYNGSDDPRTWTEKHLQNKSDETGVMIARKAISGFLGHEIIEAGTEWAPEKFIQDTIDTSEILKTANRIYSQAQAYDVVRFVTGLTEHEPKIDTLVEADISALLSKLPAGASISDLFTQIKTGNIDNASATATSGTPLISASEFNNGVAGYIEDVPANLIVSGGVVTVAKDGKPLVSRVQRNSFVKNCHVIPLRPKMDGLSEKDLVVLAALIECQTWRYNYMRAASWARMSQQVIT